LIAFVRRPTLSWAVKRRLNVNPRIRQRADAVSPPAAQSPDPFVAYRGKRIPVSIPQLDPRRPHRAQRLRLAHHHANANQEILNRGG